MLKTIEEIKERLIASYDPDRIILYGSRTRGENGEKSDIDLLILKDTEDRPIDRRIQVERILADRLTPLDIVVYTPQEMRHLFSIGSPFIQEIIETGKVIYEKKGLSPLGELLKEDAERATAAAENFMKSLRKVLK